MWKGLEVGGMCGCEEGKLAMRVPREREGWNGVPGDGKQGCFGAGFTIHGRTNFLSIALVLLMTMGRFFLGLEGGGLHAVLFSVTSVGRIW